jgi:hypothetical protein
MRYLLTCCALCILMCSYSQKVKKSEYANGINLYNYKTFGFYDIDTSGLINPANFVGHLETLKTAIRKELEGRGFSESDQPELKINMGLVVEEKIQTREADIRTDPPVFMGQRNYGWQNGEVFVGYYNKGTLDFHMVDAVAKNMIWYANVSDVIPNKQNKVTKTINRGVRRLFSRFPARPKT